MSIAKKIAKLLPLLGVAGALSACTGTTIPQDATTPDKAAPVTLELEKQEVRRYDCNGNLLTDQVESVNSGTNSKLMNLEPNRPTSVSYQISGSSFTDAETSSSAPMILGDHTHFYIDHGDGALGMHVVTGINQILYRFSFSDGASENGSRYINVVYSEKLIPGIMDVHPTPDQCMQPSPTPTP